MIISRQMVHMYHDVRMDAVRVGVHLSVTGVTAPGEFSCAQCGDAFLTSKARDAHSRSKHGTRCSVNDYIGDVSVCPVCHTEYRSRLRLLAHLSDTRIRSKHRGTSCNAEFLASKPKRIDAEVLAELHKKDRLSRNAAIKLGHTHELATVPCQRLRPSVLTGILSNTVVLVDAPVLGPGVRRRLRGKPSPGDCGEMAIPIAKRRRILQKSRPA